MAAGNTAAPASAALAAAGMESSSSPPPPPLTAEEAAAKVAHKRYEGLVMVRNKAIIKGKGAWYWTHLEPLLLRDDGTGLPKAVKLKCCLCDTVFSASNPSRTASEHLKRGTCPNFTTTTTTTTSPNPISTVPPTPASADSSANHRKRSSSAAAAPSSSYNIPPPALIDPPRYPQVEGGYSPSTDSPPALVSPSSAAGGASGFAQHHQQQNLVLSGGKEDLGPLAVLENNVKRLKSPITSPGSTLSKSQVDFALDCLADWVYESCGSVSFSSLEHPKFKAFLRHVGLPALSVRDFSGSRLDAKYEEAKGEAEAKIRDAMFFQIASDGWNPKSEDGLVNLTINLPNGTSVFRRAVLTGCGQVPSKYAEEVLWETIGDICGSSVQKCVGIVSDRFKNKALRNMEGQNQWMVNLSCQYQAFISLIKDLSKELPLFMSVAENCRKIANFVNSKTQVRNSFRKYQLKEYGCSVLLRVPVNEVNTSFEPVLTMVEDILGSARALQSLLRDEALMVSLEDPATREFTEMIRNPGFWNDLEAVYSLVRLIKGMAHDIETERPLVGECLPLWEELRSKLKNWCLKFHTSETFLDRVLDHRFKKNYHPAWAAAYILDPLYLIRDSCGKYLPPFKHLTPQQEKDVDKIITRLVSREEAHIVLMELMKWRAEGLDPVYARAVQMKKRDPVSGKMRVANPQSSRLVWETYLTEFRSLGKVAVRLIFLQATSCGFKFNASFLRWVRAVCQSKAGIDKAHKMVFVAAHSKLERRDFSCDDEKDAELFAEDDVLNEVFVDSSSM